MFKNLKRLISSIDDFMDKIYVRLSGDHRYYNREGFDIYMLEVNNDIRFMNHYLQFSKFERDKMPEFQYYLKKYRKSYCPSFQYKYFSDQNKLEYCYKRVEIDEILKKAEGEFSDFLPN